MRKPPTERWPLIDTRSRSAAPATKASSSSGAPQPEGHVHVRTALPFGVRNEELAAVPVEHVVDQLALRRGPGGRRLQAADLVPQPARHEEQHVYAEDVRRVETRPLLRLAPVAEHRVQVVAAAFEQAIRNDHHGQPRGPGVLLRAGVEQAELADVDRARQKVRRHVAHQGRIPDRGRAVELDALDRLVRRAVNVGRGRRQIELRVIRHANEVVAPAVPGHVDFALARSLDRCLAAPGAGQDVARRQVLTTKQVDRDHRELQRSAALKKQHLIVVRNAKQLAQIGLRFGQDRVERRRTVTELQHGAAGAGQREQVALYLLQDRHREHRGTRGEVEHAPVGCRWIGGLSTEGQGHECGPCGCRPCGGAGPVKERES